MQRHTLGAFLSHTWQDTQLFDQLLQFGCPQSDLLYLN